MITFAVTVCNELSEFVRLTAIIGDYPNSQLLIQSDANRVTPEVLGAIEQVKSTHNNVDHYSIPLDNEDFGAFKNKLFDNARGEWIFQIDADEYPCVYLLDVLPEILESNADTDVLLVPRLNYVRGLTEDHVREWGWKLSTFGDDNHLVVLPYTIDPGYMELIRKYGRVMPSDTGEVVCEEPVVNFPDYQWRLYRNKPEIRWVNRVHERLIGFTSYTALPSDPDYCLIHRKEISRQEKQNERYSKIS